MNDMQPEIVIALLSVAGTLGGSFFGVLASQRLTQYRLECLEEKVNRHNQVVERMAVAEKEIRVANHRISDLENKAEDAGQVESRVTVVERDLETAFRRIDDVREVAKHAEGN